MNIEDKIVLYEDVRREYQEQISSRMSKEQYQEYNEILFSTHSCAIEGNSFTIDDTKTLKELGLGMMPVGKKLLECVEMADHLRAYEYVMDNLQHTLDEAFLKHVNRLITEHTLSYHAPNAVAGEYTTEDMAAGDTIFGDHETLIARVPKLLESTEQALQGVEQNPKTVHPMVIASRFHGYYEYLHPFRDGNGRTGRLVSNYILMRTGHPLLTIYKEERQQYIAALKQIRTEGTDEFLTHFFFDTATRHMQESIEQKHKNSMPRMFLF